MLQVVSTISQYRQETDWNRPRSASLPFLGLSKGFWLRMQSSHGLRVKNRPLGESST
jgi:hypothetical protein